MQLKRREIKGGNVNSPLDVPYRLETSEDIIMAMEHNLLGLGKYTFQKLLQFNKGLFVINKPASLIKAKPVSKEFFIIKERKETKQFESYKKSGGISSISNYSLLKDHIPGIEELIDPEYLNACMLSASDETDNKRMRGNAFSLKHYRRLRKLICEELRSMVHRNMPRSMTLNELKRVMVASTLHDNRNRDILHAMKLARATGDQILWENAIAELLFARIPRDIKSFFIDNSRIAVLMREKLLSKISKLSMPPNLKIALFHMAPRINTTKRDDFTAMMNKILLFIDKVDVLDEKSKLSLICFIRNMIRELGRWGLMYQNLFLADKELQKLYSLYVPNNKLVTCNLVYTERIVQIHCSKQVLYMYPSKDYLDLEKYRWSNDCTRDTLGESQLATPHFFNIRLFRDNREYCGNIYMLQLEHDSKYCLLVDRIQTSKFSTRYASFYQALRDAFMEMFNECPFYEVLLPNALVSNNKSLNEIFHNTKRAFPKKQIQFNVPDDMRPRFESLRNNEFRVLCRKSIRK